ncbi:MAG: transglycosylase SLT domain-containing protein, partial [Candidatus Poribacteria bacterium]|nr:transglycosylase SLT domain-containing protein [Candidatus Poribacteria bacterium]
ASPPTQPKTQPVVSAPKETPLPTVATPIAETPSQTADESVVQARRAVPVLSSESFTLASIRDRQPGRLAPVEEPDLSPAYVEPEPIVSIPSVPPRTTSPKRVITSAVDKQPDIPSNLNRNLRGLIEHHANKYGVEVELILAMMRTESAFNPHAISTSKAVGLFQLLPGAAGDMGIEISGGDLLDKNRDGRFDPIRNADAGIRYLAHLLQRFDWNYALAIAAYNAGPGRVTDDIPQRRETERHVGKVLNYYFQYRNDANTLASAWQRIESISVN